MNNEIINGLKQRAEEMLKNDYSRKIGDEEIYTIICEWEKTLDLYNKEKEKNKRIKDGILCVGRRYGKSHELKMVLEEYVSKDKITKILGIEEEVGPDYILKYLETIVAENNRLEDIEDRKVQIEYENVFNKGVKSVEEKIREKIKELDYEGTQQYWGEEVINILKKILEE